LVHRSPTTALIVLVITSLWGCGLSTGKIRSSDSLDSGRYDGSGTAEVGDLEPYDEDGSDEDNDEEDGSENSNSESESPDGAPEDDSIIEASHLPDVMACGESRLVAIAVRNTGLATWTREAGYKLGTIDDADPFYSADTRVWLSEDDEVEQGVVWTFEFALLAPEVPGNYVTDWQMVHEDVQWFGEAVTHEIEVVCDVPSGPPELEDTIWLHADVSDWPETSALASVTIEGDQICLDYDQADAWPLYDLRGTEVVANPWIFIWQDANWYAATWEWLRPGQTCKSVDAVSGSHIKVEPFGEDSGWVPTSGQTYWFMVSGLGRWSERTVEERTNLVPLTWP
jgi:hypothetical protein